MKQLARQRYRTLLTLFSVFLSKINDVLFGGNGNDDGDDDADDEIIGLVSSDHQHMLHSGLRSSGGWSLDSIEARKSLCPLLLKFVQTTYFVGPRGS